jgi:hypothetical protein
MDVEKPEDEEASVPMEVEPQPTEPAAPVVVPEFVPEPS